MFKKYIITSCIYTCLVSPLGFADSSSQPDLPELSGIVVHSSISSTEINLSDSIWSNCQPASSNNTFSNFSSDFATRDEILSCDVDSAVFRFNDKEFQFTSGKYFGPGSFSPSRGYYLKGQIELQNGIFDSFLFAIILQESGEYAGYLKLADANITEQIIFKN